MREAVRTDSTVNELIQKNEGTVYIPLPDTVIGPEGPYKPFAHISWGQKHLNVLVASEASLNPKYYSSDFRLSIDTTQKSPRWKIVHREVDPGHTKESTGESMAETTVNIMHMAIQKLHHSFRLPGTVFIESSRPSLVRFFEKAGYTPDDEESFATFNLYMQEYRSRPRADFNHTDPNKGSRFLLVHESSRKDPVLVDKHHNAYDPNLLTEEPRLVRLSKTPTMRGFVHLPCVVRVPLSKEV